MCRNIQTLYNFEPEASDDEVRSAALQYVRKISGFTKPSQRERGGIRPCGGRRHRRLPAAHPRARDERAAQGPRGRGGEAARTRPPVPAGLAGARATRAAMQDDHALRAEQAGTGPTASSTATARRSASAWGACRVEGEISGEMLWSNYPRRRQDGVWTPNLRGVDHHRRGDELLVSVHGQSVERTGPAGGARSSPGSS